MMFALILENLPIFIILLGAIVLLPMGEGVEGVMRRLIVASVFTVPLAHHQITGKVLGFSEMAGAFGVGVLVGLPAALTVTGAEMFGELIDSARGQTIGSFYDPFDLVQSSHLGVLFKFGVFAALLREGLFEKVIRSIDEASAAKLRLDILAPQLLFGLCEFLSNLCILIAPFLGLFLLVELSLGFISKSAPQLSLTSEAFIIKSAIGFLILISLIGGEGLFGISQIFSPLSNVRL